MAGKGKTDSNIFATALRNFAAILSTLSGKQVVPGLNISNWKTQIVSNSKAPTFSMSVTGSFGKGELPKLDNFCPVDSKRDADNFVGLARSGNMPDIEATSIGLLGYIIATMLVGKPMSVVNAGRGQVVKALLRDLAVTELEITVYNVHMGGELSDSNPAVNKSFNLREVAALATFYELVGKRIDDLPNTTGKATKPGNVSAIKGVKITPKAI